MNKLPKKLSDLIELALDDLAKCERSKKYVIVMYKWHMPVGERCYVCLAGSVMAQSLDAPLNAWLSAIDFPNYRIMRKLKALDSVRRGHWHTALSFLNVKERKIASILSKLPEVPWYSDNRRGFKLALRKTIRVLRGHKL